MVLYEFDRELYERDLIANTRENLRDEVRAEVEARNLLDNITNLQQNLHLSLEEALKALGKTMDDYNRAQIVIQEQENKA